MLIFKLILIGVLVIVLMAFYSLKSSRRYKVLKDTSDDVFIKYYQRKCHYSVERIIQVRRQVASIFGIPPGILSPAMKITDISKIVNDGDEQMAVDDLYCEVEDLCKSNNIPNVKREFPSIDEVVLFYLENTGS